MSQTLLLANALASETGILSKAYARVSEANSEDFNIFSILNMETNEVKTHSTFLAELLNPHGSHSMGETFLQLFLNKFEIKDFEAS
ncbi:PD-(D/E)XK nuclease family protein [Owenweeksia hongkongensis]|uniref:PD-(D/E)XK nuclease family protein n=1 Tax=Owenweeksia hongkongensis TaxID=253245 RepID=UPI003A8CFB0A